MTRRSCLRTPKKREALPDVFDRRELARVMQAIARAEVWKRHFAGKPERDRFMLALMAFGGLRRSELLGLDWDDVDLSHRVVRIRKAKGGRQRTIPIHPASRRSSPSTTQRAYRSPSRPSSSASRAGDSHRALAQTFRHYVAPTGVTERKRVTPHTLRHVFASELLHAGANLRQIQELLGHKHLDSTQRYTRVDAHELRGAIKRLQFPATTRSVDV